MSECIRVLHIFKNMGNGGIEHFVMNNYRNINRTIVQFDFLMADKQPGYFDEEIKQLGGKVYYVCPLMENPIRNYKEISDVVRNNHYDIIHRHTGSAIAYWDLRAARAGGARHLIVHSHAMVANNRMAHRIGLLLKIPCIKFACTIEAAKHLFGKEYKDAKIIKNGISVNKFKFNNSTRDEERKKYSISKDQVVIGSVGALFEDKNQILLIDILHTLLKSGKKAVLWIIGDGPCMNKLLDYAENLGVTDSVCFFGNRDDVPRLLQAIDVFVLPSTNEGFSISLVEAQCSGVSCIAADTMPHEVNLTGKVLFIKLDSTLDVWAMAVEKMSEDRLVDAYEIIQEKGYDLVDNAKQLQRIYESYCERK